jgi:predicted dehydrogenase
VAEHAKVFSHLEGVALAGICSRTMFRAEKLAEQYPSLRVFAWIEEMYGETEADLVVTAVRELALAGVCRHRFCFLGRI